MEFIKKKLKTIANFIKKKLKDYREYFKQQSRIKRATNMNLLKIIFKDHHGFFEYYL